MAFTQARDSLSKGAVQTGSAAACRAALLGHSARYLHAFRLLVGSGLAALAHDLIPGPAPLWPLLTQTVSLGYLGSAMIFALLHWRRLLSPSRLAGLSLLTDMALLGVILHGFGALPGMLVALLLAYLGSAVMLLSLPIALLATRPQDPQVARLERINALIIQHLRPGVLVLDAHDHISLMNESACYLLGNPAPGERHLKTIAPPLFACLQSWRETGHCPDESLLLQATQVAIVPSFMDLPDIMPAATLIFLEDTSTLSRRARDLAQASLTRLSASIAHEIRNPLGALSHAAQLLGESEALTATDRKLMNMILSHSSRMNDIVENVLKLSRREPARTETVNLVSWTRRLVQEFANYHRLAEDSLRLELPAAAMMVAMDPGQLTQAVWNLLENSLRHAGTPEKPPLITVRVSPIRGNREAALDVLDDGPGIPADQRRQVFEPFFTTHHQGSGLGLYVARQLCDANQAPLEYVQMPNTGACFRILLPRAEAPDRPILEQAFKVSKQPEEIA